MTSPYDYDLVVIGAGSGGVRAARMAAGFGARVAILEDRDLGGTCVNVGCVPKKLFVYASAFADAIDMAGAYGWNVAENDRFDWRRLVENKDAEIKRLNGVYGRLLEGAGAEIVYGRGVVSGPHEVTVGERTLRAEKILIATGSKPVRPPAKGAELGLISDDLFHLETLPKRVIITGAGYIGLEFATVFAGLGVEAHVIHRGDKVLRGFDEDIRDFVAEEIRKKGVTLHLGHGCASFSKEGETIRATLKDGELLEGDLLVHAIGRVPNTEGLGLESAGVELGARGEVKVDAHFRTNVPSIFAVGDVIDRVQLTPMALEEGMAFAKRQFNGEDVTPDYEQIPTAVFTRPNIGTVGLTQAQAAERYERLVIYKSEFRPMKQTLAGGQERTMMKLVVDAETDRVVGCHMVGADAGEIVQGLAVAMRAGATKAHFDATLGVHPTSAEEFVTMRTPVSE